MFVTLGSNTLEIKKEKWLHGLFILIFKGGFL